MLLDGLGVLLQMGLDVDNADAASGASYHFYVSSNVVVCTKYAMLMQVRKIQRSMSHWYTSWQRSPPCDFSLPQRLQDAHSIATVVPSR